MKLFLEPFGLRAAALNAELPANSRSHCLDQFNRGGAFDLLVATDAGVEAEEEEEEEEEEDEEGVDEEGSGSRAAGGDVDGGGRKKKSADDKKRKQIGRRGGAAGSRGDGEFGVSRGVDFQGVWE